MKIYTRTGDAGETGVVGGRVRKDDIRVEAYGMIDELNSFVGQTIASMERNVFGDLMDDLLAIQHELFDCGSDLALLRKDMRPMKVTAEMVAQLEKLIDRYDAETPDITKFILPGGSLPSSLLHVCRTVCRRAERRVVTLAAGQEINDEVRRYLNRLSDLFFTVARTANHGAGLEDVAYERSADVFRKTK